MTVCQRVGFEVIASRPDCLVALDPVVAPDVATYGFLWNDPYADTTATGRSREVILAEVGPEGDYLGLADIACSTDSRGNPLEGQPFVSYIETDAAVQRRGFGARRLRIMNDLAGEHFGDVLHSNPTGETSPEAAALWRHLAGLGLAEMYENSNQIPVFRFT